MSEPNRRETTSGEFAHLSQVVVVVNPATRRSPEKIVAALREFAPTDLALEVFETTHQGHASELVRQHAVGADLVIAVGGDGTVGEVAGAARDLGIDFGIMPAGSTNIVARELGIPTDPARAAQVIFGPHERIWLDAGICNGRLFLHMVGAGVDSLMFELTNPQMKRKIGWMAYVPAAVQALSRPSARYTISSPEKSLVDVPSPLVLVANGGSVIAPSISIDRRIRVDDGLLDVFVVTATRPDHLARVIASMITRQMAESPFVEHFTVREVSIDSEPAMSVQIDGDVVGTMPVSVNIQPGTVRVVVPPN